MSKAAKKRRVLVAMSGGVDSAVAAMLLCEQGFEVVGVTMCLGIKDEVAHDAIRCCGIAGIEAARRVCDKLVIPHHTFDYAQEFTDMVVTPFVQAYAQGRTPNPCVECNRRLKFDSLFKKALALEYDFLATGHYAGIEERGGRFFIKRASDRRKDQSYFLYAIAPSALRSIIFPLAELTKEEVRARARAAGLPVADRGESQDICFIKGDYADFITKRLGVAPAGSILDIHGKKLGEHRGIIHYTLGQRSGLGLSSSQPLYVLKIDTEHNALVVGEKRQTLARQLIATEVNLFSDELPALLKAKIRYGSAAEVCEAYLEKGRLLVSFVRAQTAITPGQSIVIYDGELVVGGGIITEVIDGHC